MAVPKRKARVQLSPPQNIYFSKVLFSVGNDLHVQVDPLRQLADGSFLITVHVKGTQKARALATLLVLRKQIGGIIIRVQVRNQSGKLVCPIKRSLTPAEIAALYQIAFRTNRLFVFAAVRRLPFTGVFPVFKAKVVQFFADNLADLFRNLNEVAAFVFRDVLKQTIGQTPIQFSTAQKK
ncbi:hypothetical protein [Paenibacillus sp. MBLB4367]|uniref:hypothetical protein n=1 Tax=Paenibacillus sp. MBLB4367 TaxID=3384767 RepID=UPI003908450F